MSSTLVAIQVSRLFLDLSAMNSNHPAIHQGAVLDSVLTHPHRPQPDPATGFLVVDPDIELKAKKFNLLISFVYSSQNTDDFEYGLGRTASVRAYVLSSTVSTLINIVRGDLSQPMFLKVGTAMGITTYMDADPLGFPQGITSTVKFDGTQFTETYPDGMQLIYEKKNTNSGDSIKHELVKVQDAQGVCHTYAYEVIADIAYLRTITVPGGRKATFGYVPSTGYSLLNYVEDWGNRRTTLQYDSERRLTTLTTPLGCITKYFYNLSTPHLLDAIEDPRGYRTSYIYAPGGNQVVSMIAGSATWEYGYSAALGVGGWAKTPAGAITTFEYSSGSPISIQNPEGYTTNFTYNNRLKTKEVTPAGTIYSVTYDENIWQILLSDDALGYRTTLQYNTAGDLTTLINAEGKISTFGWDVNRTRIRQTDPLGRVTQLGYDGDGQMTLMIDPRGLRTTLQYDQFGNVTTIINSAGKTTTMGYDILNRRIRQTTPMGFVSLWDYDAADHVISMTNAAGEMSRNIYDGCLLQATVDPLGNRSTFTYGRFANKLTEKNALGFVTTTQYESMGYLTTVINPLGNTQGIVYNAARQRIAEVDALGYRTSFGFDDSGRQNTVRDARNFVTTTQFDPKGQVTTIINALGNASTFAYNKIGQQVSATTPLGFTSVNVYDDAGQAIASVDALGYRTTTSYDANGNRVTMMDANNKISTWQYETDSNQLKSVINALDRRTTMFYDDDGRQIATQNARGYLTTTTFDEVGRVRTIKTAVGAVTTLGYDDAGRQVTSQDPLGHIYTTAYNAIGQPVTVQSPMGFISTFVYNEASQQIAAINPRGYASTTVFDENGRVIVSINPLGYRNTFGYDEVGNQITSKNPRGYITTTAFNGLGQAVSIIDALGGIVTSTYDEDSRNTVMIDALGGRITMTYSNRNEMLTEKNQIGKITTLTFDPVGRRATRRLPNNALSTYSYDDIGQLTGILYSTGNRVTNMYDPVGNRTTLIDSTGTTLWAYDEIDRVSSTTMPGNVSQSYNYFLNNLVNEHTVDSEFRVHSYNDDDQVINITIDRSENNQFGYNDAGWQISSTLSNGLITQNTYDPTGQVVSIISNTPGPTLRARLTLTYDENGNRKSVLNLEGQRSTYTYDEKDRLTQDVTIGINTHTYNYTYNLNDDRLTSSENGLTTSTYAASGKLVTSLDSDGIKTYTYDDNGNLILVLAPTDNEIATMTYDEENMMAGHHHTTTKPTATRATYTYSDNFKRTEIVDGAISTIIWSGSDYAGEIT